MVIDFFISQPEGTGMALLVLAALCYWQGGYAGRVEFPFGKLVGALFGASAALYVFGACAYLVSWATQAEVMPHHALLPLCFMQHGTAVFAYVAMRMRQRTAVFMLFDGVDTLGVFWTWKGARDLAGKLGVIVDVSPKSRRTNVWTIRVQMAEPPTELAFRIERHYL